MTNECITTTKKKEEVNLHLQLSSRSWHPKWIKDLIPPRVGRSCCSCVHLGTLQHQQLQQAKKNCGYKRNKKQGTCEYVFIECQSLSRSTTLQDNRTVMDKAARAMSSARSSKRQRMNEKKGRTANGSAIQTRNERNILRPFRTHRANGASCMLGTSRMTGAGLLCLGWRGFI